MNTDFSLLYDLITRQQYLFIIEFLLKKYQATNPPS